MDIAFYKHCQVQRRRTGFVEEIKDLIRNNGMDYDPFDLRGAAGGEHAVRAVIHAREAVEAECRSSKPPRKGQELMCATNGVPIDIVFASLVPHDKHIAFIRKWGAALPITAHAADTVAAPVR